MLLHGYYEFILLYVHNPRSNNTEFDFHIRKLDRVYTSCILGIVQDSAKPCLLTTASQTVPLK